MKISDITGLLEQHAPLTLQESYDNCGLQVGDPSAECTGVLLTLDALPSTVDEAVEKGCNLIVTHHPLLFKGLKKITGRTVVEQTVIKAISAKVAIYSLHTAIDNAPGGVSYEMAHRLDLHQVRTLAPQADKMVKLQVYVPDSHATELSEALFRAGAGKQGLYDSCSFTSNGTGSFRPLDGAKPYVHSGSNVHYEAETRIELLAPVWLKGRLEDTIRLVHPYEEPAYDFFTVDTACREFGSGTVGQLSLPLKPLELVDKVKQAFGSPIVRCTKMPSDPITTVAMCGGSGSFLINDAISAGAQAFITSDTSYHNFVDYSGRIFIIDIGHYESESCTKEIFYRIIREKFPNFAVHYSSSEKNPIIYL